MPDFNAYPTAESIEAKLKSMAFWPADSETTKVALARNQAAIGAAAASAEWETITGWKPFLSTSATPVERVYDGSDHCGEIDLRAGLLSLTSVTIGETAQVITGASRNVWLYPANAAADGEPYTKLRFGVYGGMGWYGSPNQITVIGRWGYCTTLPGDVYEQILGHGALITLIGSENAGDVSSISQDGFAISYDPVGRIDPKTVLNTLGKDFSKLAARYKRVVA